MLARWVASSTVALLMLGPGPAAAQATSCETYRQCARDNRAKKRGVATNDAALEAAAKSCDAAYASCLSRNASAPAGGLSPAATKSTPADLVQGLAGIMGSYLESESRREQELQRRAAEEEERRLEREERLAAEQERRREAAEAHRRDLEDSFSTRGGAGVLVDRDPAEQAFQQAFDQGDAAPATAEPDAATCADPILRLANPEGCARRGRSDAAPPAAPPRPAIRR